MPNVMLNDRIKSLVCYHSFTLTVTRAVGFEAYFLLEFCKHSLTSFSAEKY